MTKKDKIISIISSVFIFLIFPFILDEMLAKMNPTTVFLIAMFFYLPFLGYHIYLVWKIFSTSKRTKKRLMQQYGATLTATLKHTEGLPLAKGVLVDVYYGPEKILFKKDNQEIARSKISDIDCVTGEAMKSQMTTGAVAGKYILGGLSGAVIGSLIATTIYLVISYTSDGSDKYVILDTAASGTFAHNVQKDFKQNDTSAPKSIEL